ncbi:tol-pal system-associated acyl-CoA thioesterase [Thiorhodococcus drewsii AZ1]|uniref:Tol-pal system-associated acyl-CoA thioesterase n=2 Tax=Thiorhodococcus drewsii TaxID=210408 RepID=G2E6H6_9GAMM|nr:tol-pal system-associated acyl-CoA thioesterase [Thiorhodococcus drewsii AZ1]
MPRLWVSDTLIGFLGGASYPTDIMANASELSGVTFDWPVRVYYEDTDAAGVVFYANYLRFMERGRTEWLRSIGYEQDVLRDAKGILFAVRRVNLEYQNSALFNELLLVRSAVTHLGGASMEFEQSVLRPADGKICCRGEVNVVCLDATTKRPRRLPSELAAAIQSSIGCAVPASSE